MSAEFLIPLLALITMGAAVGFALFSKSRTQEMKKDDTAPKSSLAADGDSHRVAN